MGILSAAAGTVKGLPKRGKQKKRTQTAVRKPATTERAIKGINAIRKADAAAETDKKPKQEREKK